MRALGYYGVDLRLEQNYLHPTPIEGEALIRVLQVGICNTDLEIIRGYMDFRGVPGHEFVGIVEEIYGEKAQNSYGHLLRQRVVGDICSRTVQIALRSVSSNVMEPSLST